MRPFRPSWVDVGARARGLGTRLLPGHALAELARAGSLPALAAGLAARGYPLSARAREGSEAPALEAALRAETGARLRLLDRWLGRRRPLARVVYEDEERRSVRALVRGAAQGAPPARRLAGLVPTPGLDEAALERLAGLDSPAEVVAGLAARGHPLVEGLAPGAYGTAAELLELEVAVDRAWARRAAEGARPDRRLRRYVEGSIDLENAWSLLAADAETLRVEAEALFVDGGRRLDRRRFAEAAAADADARRRLVSEALGPGPLAGVLGDVAIPSARLEARALAARVEEQRAAMRREPLGPAPFLLYALRLRAELVDLRRVVWGIALGAPAEVIVGELTGAA